MRITGARRKIETAAAIQKRIPQVLAGRSCRKSLADWQSLADGHFAPADACALTDTPLALTGIRLRSGGCIEDTDRLSIPQVAVL
jgi:hypothetical protein